MISSTQIEQTIPSSATVGELAANVGSSKMNSFALTFLAIATKPTYSSKVIESKRPKPKQSQISRWLADLFHGKLRLVPEKKLRVVETVSLGERRFVTIIQVEGRKFLIGGSSSNVSMLASLDNGGNPAELLKFQPEQTEPLQ